MFSLVFEVEKIRVRNTGALSQNPKSITEVSNCHFSQHNTKPFKQHQTKSLVNFTKRNITYTDGLIRSRKPEKLTKTK